MSTMIESSILTQVEPLDSIRSVLDWAHSQTPPAEVIDAIAQDEVTHDIVVLVLPKQFLVFDVTSLGHVRNVALWDHAPSPDELLELRLSRGWVPTPTPTKNGDLVLGYAAVLDGVPA
jgi:hypothetical protein